MAERGTLVAKREVDQSRIVRPGEALAVLLDSGAWGVGLSAAVLSRYESTVSGDHIVATLIMIVAAGIVQTAVSHVKFLRPRRYVYASFEEGRAVSVTVLTTALLLLVGDLLIQPRPAPVSEPVVGGAIALVVMLAVRCRQRLRHERSQRPDPDGATRVLLFGAGAAAHLLLQSMLSDRRGRYLPVGLIDDDPARRHLKVKGVAVLGDRTCIPAALKSTGASTVFLSVANADSALVCEIRGITVAAGAAFRLVPSVSELINNRVPVTAVRDVQITDLLGRHQIDTDLDAIAGYLKGKRVLVTGAGGSIGSELCRQICRYAPAELMMLDRDESALHAVQLSLDTRASLDDPSVILADLRDAATIRMIFQARRPQVVFHAAALKHLPMLQRFPGEAVKTNVWGTLAVLEAGAGVERFVNISTDKAANPCCVLGYSKRITERLTAHRAATSRGSFLSVRFGNVLDSRGSVLTTFHAQIAAGGPMVVTHPDVTRYFMTTQEAVHLVIQAAAIGRDGEALVLQMGKPVRIAEVARQMAQLASAPIDIEYSSLRPGEKLHEDLFGADEIDRRPLNPLISHVRVPPLDPSEVRLLDTESPPDVLISRLAALCASAPQSRTLGLARHENCAAPAMQP
jgi:FlaA1/EpsC-like NDP-sugar epimerase